MQVYTPFRADIYKAQGNAALGEGIGRGLVSVGDAIGRAIEAKKNRNASAKSFQTIVKGSPILQEKLGLDAEDFSALSADDQISKATGAIAALKIEEQMEAAEAAREERMARLLDYESRMAERAAAGRVPGRMMELLRPQMERQPGDFPLSGPAFQGRVAQRTGMTPAVRAFVEAAAAERVPVPDAAIEQLMRGSGNAMGPEMLARLGMVPTGGQLNPNNTVSWQFGPPEPPPPTEAVPIPLRGGQPSGKATFGEKIIDIQAPNAEGKTLTQSETQMLGALNQAEEDLSRLEKLFKDLGPDWGGPLSGRAKSMAGMGQNPNIAAIENAITAATPNLARGVFREVGVLTDEDIKRYKALLPTAYDTDAVRGVKMKQLRERIKQGKAETMDMLRKAGRDLSGFDKAGKSANVLKAELDVARAAIKRGKDPAAVKARYKERTGQDFPE